MAYPDAPDTARMEQEALQAAAAFATRLHRKRPLESVGKRTSTWSRFRGDNEEDFSDMSLVPRVVDDSSAFGGAIDQDFEANKAPRKHDKGCRCGRTKCLKQYCTCFRNDTRCTADCICRNCHNDGKHEELRMKAVKTTRLNDPSAFKGTSLEIENREVLTASGSVKTIRGCRCKRSRCQKKYCECFSVGLPCGSNCVCEDCLNSQDRHEKRDNGQEPMLSAWNKGPLSVAAPQTALIPPNVQGMPARPVALTARRPLVSVHVPSPNSRLPQQFQQSLVAVKKEPSVKQEPFIHPVRAAREVMMEEPEATQVDDDEAHEEWEGDGDLSTEQLLSARSDAADNMWGAKPLPLQARNGWDGDEDSVVPGGQDAQDWGHVSSFADKEMANPNLLSPRLVDGFGRTISGLDPPSLLRNPSGLCLSRNASGIDGGNMDWTTALPSRDQNVDSTPTNSLILAKQLSEEIPSF